MAGRGLNGLCADFQDLIMNSPPEFKNQIKKKGCRPTTNPHNKHRIKEAITIRRNKSRMIASSFFI